MRRSLDEIAGKCFDLVVVGGGIHGVCVTRDAALRGLSVALLERGDFGGETSHNSLKIVHGGLRYIQHLDFGRMRQYGLERRAWMRIAPHLVRPLKFAMHTNGHSTRGPEALWSAIRIHELIGFDRNAGVVECRRISKGNIVGRHQSDILIPGLEQTSHNGAACWYDGQIQDADRIVIECVDSAVAAGAIAANHVHVSGLLGNESRVRGVTVEDKLTGNRFDVLAKVTVNTAGPWADRLRFSKGSESKPVMRRQPQNLNMNIVIGRTVAEHAIGVKSVRRSDSRVDEGGRLFFITPWRGVSVIGTTHDTYDGDADECFIDEAKLYEFIDEVNAAYPPAKIARDDVIYCHWGLTPGEEGLNGGEARRARHGQIVDHWRKNNLAGLISVVGVKWTNARLVAENVVDIAADLVGGVAGECRTSTEPLRGAEGFQSCEVIERDIRATMPTISRAEDVSDLAIEYGTRWRDVVGTSFSDVETKGVEIFRRKALFAVKSEMAVRLTDVLCHRTSLLQRGKLRSRQVSWCLDMMTGELEWSEIRKKSELAAFERQRLRNHATILP